MGFSRLLILFLKLEGDLNHYHTAINRFADTGLEPFPPRRQVVEAVHAEHAEDGRIRAADVAVQAQEGQRVVALRGQERGRRGASPHGKSRESKTVRTDTARVAREFGEML